jgi:hypothetical protein
MKPALIFALALSLGFSILSPCLARDCDEDTLSEKSESGEILMMMSGAVFEVLPGDQIDSALWLPPEDVLICSSVVTMRGKQYVVYDIINTDEHGEKVGATRLR